MNNGGPTWLLWTNLPQTEGMGPPRPALPRGYLATCSWSVHPAVLPPAQEPFCREGVRPVIQGCWGLLQHSCWGPDCPEGAGEEECPMEKPQSCGDPLALDGQ